MKQLFFVLVLVLCFHYTNAFIQINNDTLQYVDESGRTRIFHGVNAVYKIPPWHPELTDFNTYSSLVQEDMKDLQSWGFNVIRLGVLWAGVSIAENQYNTTYLEVMNELVTTLGSYGIYTIVDCHQDLFSRYFCGEGAPDWLVPQNSTLEFPLPVREPSTLIVDPVTGYPNISSCEETAFFQYYFTGAVGNGFQQLYDNTNNLQDHFIEYWQQIAQTFKNNEYVLGYELINEPWCGDYLQHPKSIFPKYADENYLFPMYQSLNNAIRSIDNDHIIFYEAAVSDITPAGFTEGPGGPSYNNRQAYSYHVYCAPTDSDGDPTKPVFCNDTLDITFHVKQDDLRHQGVAGFMTEFGALKGTTTGIESLNYLMDLADKKIQSWAYWQYKYYADITTASSDGAESFYVNGVLDTGKVKALSRTYAPIIAGNPTKHEFNPETEEFILDFIIDTTISPCTTEIFANQDYYYSNGMNIDVSDNLVIASQVGNSILFNCTGTGRASIKITNGA